MAQFTGTLEGTFDAKKARLSVPAPYRHILGRLNAEEVVLRASNNARCIEVWPQPTYQVELDAALQGLNRFSADYARQARKLAASVVTLRLDTDGRLTLPATLIEHAQLEAAVSFVGAVDMLHIWNPRLFAEQLARDAELDALETAA